MEGIEEREKRSAAIHEAGHAAVMRHFGGDGQPRIWPNEPGREGECAWLGHFQAFKLPERGVDEFGILFGMAGFVAEKIDAGITNYADIGSSLEDAITFDELSQTDAEAIGESWDFSHVEQAMKLLLEAWPKVDAEASHLIAEWTHEVR